MTVFRFRGTRWREYLECFSLLGSESAAVRYLHLEMQIQVAKAPAVELLHAHSLQHLLRLWLRSLGNLDSLFALERWHSELRAHHGFIQRQRDIQMQVVTIASKIFVRLNAYGYCDLLIVYLRLLRGERDGTARRKEGIT